MDERESIYLRAANRALAGYEEVIRKQKERIDALEEPLKVYVEYCPVCHGTGAIRVVEPDGNLLERCRGCLWARDLLK